MDTIDVPRPGSQFSNFLALNAASDRLYYSSGTGLVSVNIKTNEVRSIQAFGGTARGLAYDSARQRLYILDDTGMTAVDAQQIESSPSPEQLPGTGGLPADTGANQWILLGGMLAARGCLFLRRSFSRRPDQHP